VFFGWLLGAEADETSAGIRIGCENGDLLLRESTTPLSVEWEGDGGPFSGEDPDGVAVAVGRDVRTSPGSAALDHVRLNCADLAATVDFYLRMGLQLTWAGGPDGETLVDGRHDTFVPGSEWVHLGAADGYLSLSQADWLDYGIHSSASGPPRFVHVGFAVRDFEGIVRRLADGDVPHRMVTGAVGRQVYLNDPDGDPALGHDVELVEYAPGIRRSGHREGVA
jgi:catechol 2,3-dioxygenase-like lactoylglutathione lyase family enzyme